MQLKKAPLSAAPPATMAELYQRLCDPGLDLFSNIMGLPRAYMEFPVSCASVVERWVYTVVGWECPGTPEVAEPIITARIWQFFMEAHKELSDADLPRLIVWRRLPEMLHDGPFGSGRSRGTVRLHIPGFDIGQREGVCGDGVSFPVLKVA